MAEPLSVGVIAFLCTVVITTTILIILYCVCRSTDPLLDHTCRAWLYSSRIAKKGKHQYDVLPLHQSQNGRKASREDKFGTIEKLRKEDKTQKHKLSGVDMIRNKYYERNPEKCPLSIDEPDFYRKESAKERRETGGKDYDKKRRDRAFEYHSRNKEYWEPKAKSIHDIYVNEQSYSHSLSRDDNNADGYPSRSLNFIDKFDEQDGGGTSSLYLHPRPLKSDHYVRPRSLERDGKDERERKGESHRSSSHYVRPHSQDMREVSHRSSAYKVTDSLYVHPRTAAEDTSKEKYYQNVTINDEQIEKITMSEVQELSSQVAPEIEQQRDRDKHNQRRLLQEDRDRAKAERKRDEKQRAGPQKRNGSERQSRPRSRSTEYRTRSAHELNDDGWSNHKKREKESYFLPRTQSVTSARPPKNVGSPIARRHTIHLEFHPRSGDVTPVDSEKEKEFRKNHSATKQEQRPIKQKEFIPRRDVERQDGSRENNKNRNPTEDTKQFTIPPRYDSLTDKQIDEDQQIRPESEARKDENRNTAEDTRRLTIPPRYDSLPDRYTGADREPRHEEQRYEGPPKHKDFSEGHTRSRQEPHPVSQDIIDRTEEPLKAGPAHDVELNNDNSMTDKIRGHITNGDSSEPRHSDKENQQDEGPKEQTRKKDHMTDGMRITDQDTELGPERRQGHNRFPTKQFTLEDHPKVWSRKSTESTSSTATMESIHREIQSSLIYKKTDDGRLVLRDTVHEPIQDKETQRTKVPPKRTKSIERVFYVKLVPRSEPTLDFEESAEVSQGKDIDWNQLPQNGRKVELNEHEKLSTQDTKRNKLTQKEAIPSKALSDKHIDWHLFTLTGEKVDLKKDQKSSTTNSDFEEDGPTETSHQTRSGEVKHSKVPRHKNIDWHLFTVTGEKVEKKIPLQEESKMQQDETQLSKTNIKESIRQSLETQIKYGEELRTPSQNSLPGKPIVLTFE